MFTKNTQLSLVSVLFSPSCDVMPWRRMGIIYSVNIIIVKTEASSEFTKSLYFARSLSVHIRLYAIRYVLILVFSFIHLINFTFFMQSSLLCAMGCHRFAKLKIPDFLSQKPHFSRFFNQKMSKISRHFRKIPYIFQTFHPLEKFSVFTLRYFKG